MDINANPFKFGSDIATGPHFADRDHDRERLKNELKSGQRVVVFCARRLGKTALIVNVLEDLAKEGYMTAYLDVSTTPDKSLFISKYRSLFIKEGSKEWFIDWVKRNLPKIKVSLGEAEIDLSGLSEQEVNEAFGKILDLPQQLALKRKARVVVALDEFQDVESLDSGTTEKLMRSKLQFHDRVSYVFSGSQSHILADMFESRRKPFYKSATMFELRKIPFEEYRSFIIAAFRKTVIEISDEVVSEVLTRTDSNTYYTQQLCHEIWDFCKLRERSSVQKQDVEGATEQVVLNQSAVYERIWVDLSPGYRKLIMGVARANRTGEAVHQVWSSEFRTKNRLTVGAIDKALKYLTEQYLIEKSQERKGFVIPDPFLVEWISRKVL